MLHASSLRARLQCARWSVRVERACNRLAYEEDDKEPSSPSAASTVACACMRAYMFQVRDACGRKRPNRSADTGGPDNALELLCTSGRASMHRDAFIGSEMDQNHECLVSSRHVSLAYILACIMHSLDRKRLHHACPLWVYM